MYIAVLFVRNSYLKIFKLASLPFKSLLVICIRFFTLNFDFQFFFLNCSFEMVIIFVKTPERSDIRVWILELGFRVMHINDAETFGSLLVYILLSCVKKTKKLKVISC